MNDHADSATGGATDAGGTWPELIRQRRRDAGLRQDALADLAGVSVRTISAIEGGKSTVRLDVLTAVVDTLGLQLVLTAPNGTTVAIAPVQR